MKSKFAKNVFRCTGCSGFILSYHVLNFENPLRPFFLASFRNSNVCIISYVYFIHRFIINFEILHLRNKVKDEEKCKKKPC